MTRGDGWLLVIRADGIVEGVAGGAPQRWRGCGVDEVLADRPELLELLPRLIGEVIDGTCVHRVRSTTPENGELIDVELIVIEALPIRRALVPIEPLVVRTIDIFLAQARAGDVELCVHFANDLPTDAHIDGEKIAWALSTLVGGALRHVRAGREGGDGAARIDVTVAWDGSVDEIVLAVEDNGEGIPPARAKWLFDRDPATGKSAGLALLMVRDVAAAHGGSIRVDTVGENGLARGTRFVLRFPRRIAGARSG